jgi:hypothetical protein
MERLLRGVQPEARNRDLTRAEMAQAFLEEQLAKITSRERARRLSMTAFGGSDSGIPGGMGAVDFVPFLGAAKGLEEGGRDISQGNYDLESGRYGDALRNYGAAVLGVLPGAAGAVKVAPGLAKAIKAAPQDEALRLAQLRAALPPEQGGLGLPANNTPMQRAKALKYVNEGFHETEGANIESGLSSFDVRRGGAGASDEQTPYAMFIKPHPAGIGVARKNPAQMPVLVKSNLTDENILMPFQNRDELQQYLNKFPEIKQSTQAVQYLDRKMADQMEELTKKANQLDVEGKTKEADKIYELMESGSPMMKEFDAKSKELARKAKNQITDLFKSQGVGTVGLTEDRGALGRKTITDMVLNPNENVRSRFAAFDPFRKDAATAAAFGVAAPDLLAKEKAEESPKKGKAKKKSEGALPKVTQ